MRDLHEPKDGLWMAAYPAPDERIALGEIATHGGGTDLAIVTYGNGHYLSRQAQETLAKQGINARVIDLRWLAPLPAEALLAAVSPCKAVLVVDECRRTGNVSEELVTLFATHGITRLDRLTAEDSFIATGPAYAAPLPSANGIVEAALTLLERVK
jgi:2-oxoisovalerate dehydrogenase E1 component